VTDPDDQQLRAIFDCAPDAVLIADDQGRLIDVNPAGCELLGLTRAEVVGRTLAELAGPGSGIGAAWSALLADGRAAAELVVSRPDGQRRLVQLRATARMLPGRHLAVLRDVTGTGAALDGLRLSEEMLVALIDASPAAIDALDADGTVRLWNPAAERMFGWPAAEVVGRPLPLLPDDEQGALTALREGRPLMGVLGSRPTRDGRTVEVSLSRGALRDRAGKVIGAVEILLDASEQRRLEEQLIEAQKMEAVGRLAGGIAHDFNNVLAVIQGFAWISQSSLAAADPMREDLDQVLRAVDRAASLTKQLLAFSRKQVFRLQVIDVNVLVRDVQKMLNRVIGEDVELQTRLGAEAGRVRADAGQLEQVLLNLAVNARDAMPRGGVLTVETAHVQLDEEHAQQRLEVAPGEYVMIAVSDTGIGMNRQTLDHMFEPFFTTKEKGQGTGLGLSTVFGIVKQSHGHIAVDSRPGMGTTFRIYLPRTQAKRTDETVRIERPTMLRGSETVLVVEDEEMVRQLASHVLRRNGYVVLEAGNAGEALLICEKHEGEIDLLLSDVVMPRVSGADLARRLVRLRPAMKVLFMSGYSEEAWVQHGLVELAFGLLEKPFTPQALLTGVREALDQR
jgi:two-component system, cell cycle sensor histidine kinase and response regulator CckA